MGIIWHLSSGPSKFRALEEYCENISPTTLNTRIKELTQAGFIERSIDGYMLTDKGKELFKMLKPIGVWAKEWAKNF